MGEGEGKMTWQGPGAQMPPWEGRLPSQDRGSPTLEPQLGQQWNADLFPRASARPLNRGEFSPSPRTLARGPLQPQGLPLRGWGGGTLAQPPFSELKARHLAQVLEG